MGKEKIRFLGRHIKKQGREYFAFSGTGFEFTLLPHGRACSFLLCLESEIREYESQFIAIYVNGAFHAKKKLAKGRNLIEVRLDNPPTPARVKFLKLNEVCLSSLYLEDLVLKDAELGELPPPRRRIGFFGDSLTCGYGVLDYHGESFSMEGEDFSHAYAYLAAESLGMDPVVIARSGISLALKIYCDVPFPEIYDTVDMFEKCPIEDGLDCAVINLGTNDWGRFCQLQEKEKEGALSFFKKEYISLLERIIGDNPNVKLVLCQGMVAIGDSLAKAIQEAGERIQERHGNPCRFLSFSPNSEGADNHPYKNAHEEAGRLLAKAIQEMEN